VIVAQVGSTCYSSDAAAVAAIASAEVGKVVQAGATVYVVDASPASDASITYTLSPVDGSPSISNTVAVTLQPCSLLDWSDGLALGWGVGGAWLLTFAVLIMRKAAHS